MVTAIYFRWRKNTAAYWAEHDIVPRAGEPILEVDTGRFWVGNGRSSLSSLQAYLPGEGSGSIEDHLTDETPHSVYDDGPSLELLYQNAKV